MSNSVIWVVDDHKLRRESIAGFLSKLPNEDSFSVSQVERPVHIHPVELLNSDNEGAQLCILGIGGASLENENVKEEIKVLLEVLGERPLVVILDEVDSREVELAIKLGLKGLISTMLNSDVAVRAIRYILGGGTFFPSNISIRQDGAQTEAAPPPDQSVDDTNTEPVVAPQLSERQNEVLVALQHGYSNKMIARELDLSEATVKIHVRTLLKKYGASNRTQVALMAADPALDSRQKLPRRNGPERQ